MNAAKWMIMIVATILFAASKTSAEATSSSYIDQLSTKYSYSQYCMQGFRDQHRVDSLLPEYGKMCDNNSEFRGNIGDPELYSLAGFRYITGGSPASINWETQPLTKYLFGLSILVFGNPLVTQYLLGFATLITLYLLSRRVLSRYWSLVPPVLLVIDPLFRDQLKHPYLDLSLTLFALLWLLYLGDKSRERLWWMGGIVLGLLTLSKSFSLGIVAAGVGFLYIWKTQEKGPWVSYAKTISVSILVYLLGYTMFFVNGHTPLDFVTLHLNILLLYKSYVPEYPKGEIFRIIFTGQWRTWWGDKGLIQSPFWTPTWTICIITTILTFLKFKMLQNKFLLIHFIWLILALGFISMRLVFPRYLLPVLPSLYLIFTYVLASISQFASMVTIWRKK